MKTQRFSVVITHSSLHSINENTIKRILEHRIPSAVEVIEINLLRNCDGCGKDRRDVKAVGKDANGDEDAPCLCFLCRKEASRNRHYNYNLGRYVSR